MSISACFNGQLCSLKFALTTGVARYPSYSTNISMPLPKLPLSDSENAAFLQDFFLVTLNSSHSSLAVLSWCRFQI